MTPGDAAVSVCMSAGKVIAEQADRIAALEAHLADWERRSESCESKLGQLEANEKVIELKAKVRELEAERDAYKLVAEGEKLDAYQAMQEELTASRQQVERLVVLLKDASTEFKKLPHSLGYSITHCEKYDEAIAAVEKERT